MIQIKGVTFRFHPLFVLVIMTSVLTGHFVEILTLFLIVLLHEFGHLSTMLGFGWRVREVQLLPFGGVVKTDEHGSVSAWQEIAVALSGPLQNAVLAGFSIGMMKLGLWEAAWGNFFMISNVMIAGFNLLPVLPLDGGRILQALLSLYMTYHKSIQSSVIVSLFLSVLLAVYAVFPGLGGIQMNLLVIALFLLYSNYYELKNMPYQFVRFLMSRQWTEAHSRSSDGHVQPIVVHPTRTIQEITRMFIRGKYHFIYVMNELGEVGRIVPEQRIIAGYFSKKERGCAVSDVFM